MPVDMPYRRLGGSGLQVSALSFGAWVTFHRQLDLRSAQDCLAIAYDAGVNFFDNAEIYEQGEAETVMGAALRNLRWPRDSFLVSSKAFFGRSYQPAPTQQGLSRKHLRDACDQALQRLQVDYLDLYFCHRPDPSTPVEETARTMDDLIRQGKVLYWGTSEWSAEDIAEVFRIADKHHLQPPTMEQPQYNLLHRHRVEKEYRPLFRKYGLGTTTWSPLYSGLLTGKYAQGIPEGARASLPGYEWLKKRFTGEKGREQVQAVQALGEIAADIGTTVSRMAIAWCLQNRDVSTVILGASGQEQLQDNLQALEALPLLTPEVTARIEALTADLADRD